MLASACPGWICYAEKTHGELLPYVSTTKSPQQVAGVIAKRFLPERLGLLPRADAADAASTARPTIYHVTVMPCYDKKLEASRPDFYDDITSTKEVDCVLTTGELDKLMLDEGFDICSPVPGEQEAMQQSVADLSLQQALHGSAHDGVGAVAILPHFPQLLDQPGSSSGGYLFNLMRAVWLDWISEHWAHFPESVRERGVLPKLDVRVIRTADFTEYVLRAPLQLGSSSTDDANAVGSSSILFRGAQCYGFRNLQNLVRKLQKQTGARNTRGAAGRLVDADGNAVGAGGRNRAAAARARARGRGGMVRRGRGGAAGSALVNKSSPLNPDSEPAASPLQRSAAEEEEERGYDYVEVMACPSGCVNGGGQIRPPTQADVDATLSSTANKATDPEGYVEGSWAAEQSGGQDELDLMLNNKACSKKHSSSGDDDAQEVELDDGTREKEIKGWQGTSKEWVRRVEEAYWQGSSVAHTPVNVAASGVAGGVASDSGASTPTLVGSGANTPLSSSNAKSIRVEDHQRLLESLAVSTRTEGRASMQKLSSDQASKDIKVGSDTMAYADVLAELVVKELCHLSAPIGLTDDAVALDKARDALFRTQYRAVQDEAVNGLAVQW